MDVNGSGVVHHLTWLTHIGGSEIQDNIWEGAMITEAKDIYQETEIIHKKENISWLHDTFRPTMCSLGVHYDYSSGTYNQNSEFKRC